MIPIYVSFVLIKLIFDSNRKVALISNHHRRFNTTIRGYLWVRLNTTKESLVHQGHKKCTNDMNPSFYQLQVLTYDNS